MFIKQKKMDPLDVLWPELFVIVPFALAMPMPSTTFWPTSAFELLNKLLLLAPPALPTELPVHNCTK